MKYLIYIPALFFVFIVSSCTKEYTKGTIYRDCTGTYVHINDHYFNVVNSAKLASVENNAQVQVQFEEANGPGPDIVCFMVSVPNAGFIKILSVKE